MSNYEQQMHVMQLVQKFYGRIGGIVETPSQLTEEAAMKLIEEINTIINEIDKLPDFQAAIPFKTRFEVIKHKILKSMMTTPTQEEV